MQIWLVIVLFVVVLIGGTIVCVGWWKLADKWFPGTSRKTGQEIRLTKKRERDRHEAKVIRLDADE